MKIAIRWTDDAARQTYEHMERIVAQRMAIPEHVHNARDAIIHQHNAERETQYIRRQMANIYSRFTVPCVEIERKVVP